MLQTIFTVDVATRASSYTSAILDCREKRLTLCNKESRESFAGGQLVFDSFDRFECGKLTLRLLVSAGKEEAFLRFTLSEPRLEELACKLEAAGVCLGEARGLMLSAPPDADEWQKQRRLTAASTEISLNAQLSLGSALLPPASHKVFDEEETKVQRLLGLLRRKREARAAPRFSQSLDLCGAREDGSPSALTAAESPGEAPLDFPEASPDFDADWRPAHAAEPARPGLLGRLRSWLRRKKGASAEFVSPTTRLRAFLKSVAKLLAPTTDLDTASARVLLDYREAMRVTFVFHTRQRPFDFRDPPATGPPPASSDRDESSVLGPLSEFRAAGRRPAWLGELAKQLWALTKAHFRPEAIVDGFQAVCLERAVWRAAAPSFAECLFRAIAPRLDPARGPGDVAHACRLLDFHFNAVAKAVCRSMEVLLLERSRLRLTPLMVYQLRFFHAAIRELGLLYRVFIEHTAALRCEEGVSVFHTIVTAEFVTKQAGCAPRQLFDAVAAAKLARLNRVGAELASFLSFLENYK